MTADRNPAIAGEISVQDAITATVHDTPEVHVKALADAMRLPYRVLLEIADPFRQRRLRAEEIAPLVNGTFLLSGLHNYLLLDVLERSVDRIAFPIPRGASAGERTQAKAVTEFGEYLMESAAASADRVITADEAARVRQQATEATAAIWAHVEACETAAGVASSAPALRRVP